MKEKKIKHEKNINDVLAINRFSINRKLSASNLSTMEMVPPAVYNIVGFSINKNKYTKHLYLIMKFLRYFWMRVYFLRSLESTSWMGQKTFFSQSFRPMLNKQIATSIYSCRRHIGDIGYICKAFEQIYTSYVYMIPKDKL